MPAPTLLWLSRIACACDAVLWLSRNASRGSRYDASRGFWSGGGGDERSSSREKYTLTGFSTRDATRSLPVPGSARESHASAG